MSKRRRNPDRRPRRRTDKDYREGLTLLRKYYTGFESRDGFNSRKLSDSAKKLLRRIEPQIKQLKSLQTYPHREVKGRSGKVQDQLAKFASAPPGSLDYRVQVVKGKGKKRRKTVKVVKPRPKVVPVFTTDKKAKVSVSKAGALQVSEHGHKRDVYPIDRLVFNADPFKYMRDFMRKHKAKRVTINVGANVIGQAFSEADFVDAQERARRQAAGQIVPPANTAAFVNMVDSYMRGGVKRAKHFLNAIVGVSVLKGGEAVAQDFAKTVRAGRLGVQRRRMTERQRKRMK